MKFDSGFIHMRIPMAKLLLQYCESLTWVFFSTAHWFGYLGSSKWFRVLFSPFPNEMDFKDAPFEDLSCSPGRWPLSILTSF